MGNYAYKLYMMELFTLVNEEERVDFVKARFRAAVIFTSPFTLYLKSRGITTVKQLLAVDLKDLGLPRPLFAQLEILLNVIISRKIVKASLLTVPRDRYDLARDSFYTPMFYDQKFQRTPLDMFGKPIGLGVTTIKSKLKAGDLQRQEKKRISSNDFNPVIEDDLVRPVSLWANNAAAAAHAQDPDDENDGHDQPVAFMQSTVSATRTTAASSHSSQSMASSQSLGAQQFSFAISQLDGPALHEMRALVPPSSSLAPPSHPGTALPASRESAGPRHSTASASLSDSKARSPQKKAVRAAPSLSASLPGPGALQQPQEMTFPAHPLVDPKLTRTVFHQTYVCEHAGCGQLFSRLYTYKVHLRTHENFPDYFRFKRDPQLALDRTDG